jgi:hypothetical protein
MTIEELFEVCIHRQSFTCLDEVRQSSRLIMAFGNRVA